MEEDYGSTESRALVVWVHVTVVALACRVPPDDLVHRNARNKQFPSRPEKPGPVSSMTGSTLEGRRGHLYK
jgi:hypothetical protein